MTDSLQSFTSAGQKDFKEFCGDVFATLGRTDQRQAAETYLYGLLNCQGRKSIRRLVATAPGRSEQSLQQFINQSPWDPEPIRQRLLAHLVRHLQPSAWTIEEIHFPKHGRYSAGVDRQYVPFLGRVCNCQMAIAVTLTADNVTVPINWRLIVPESWGRDEDRRLRARMPDHELPRPYWQYHIEVLDDMALEWGMPAAPVLADTAHRSNVEPFLTGLELRNQPYLVQLGPTQRMWCELPGQRPGRTGQGTDGSSAAWHGTASDLVARIGNLTRETVEWRHEHNSLMRSQFLRIPIRATVSDGVGGRPPGEAPTRVLLCEWPLGKSRPRGFWITNMADNSLRSLVALAKQRLQARPRLEQFADRFGLRDHEGRTFAGWHHHVTLTSAAYTYQLLTGEVEDDADGHSPASDYAVS